MCYNMDFQCLKEHPEICVSNPKETNFFITPFLYKRGIKAYKKFFKNCPKESIKGEFSPNYMLYPISAELIYKYFPETKILLSLRNPVERAISHYKYDIKTDSKMTIYKNFEEAIRKERKLKEKGFYYKHLKNYFNVFPRDQILVIFYEDLRKNPEKTIEDIYSFLGVKNTSFVPPSARRKVLESDNLRIKSRIGSINQLMYRTRVLISNFKNLDRYFENSLLHVFGRKIIKINEYSDPLNKKPSSINSIFSFGPEIRKKLQGIYREDINKLEQLLDKDLSFWKED